jgi:hypothetical protein
MSSVRRLFSGLSWAVAAGFNCESTSGNPFAGVAGVEHDEAADCGKGGIGAE